MNRNLPLKLDEDLLRAARKVATLERSFKERPDGVGKISWTREELYDRKA